MCAERQCGRCGRTFPLTPDHYYRKGTRTDGTPRYSSFCRHGCYERRQKFEPNLIEVAGDAYLVTRPFREVARA